MTPDYVQYLLIIFVAVKQNSSKFIITGIKML